MRSREDQKGFTLLEVLVSLAILTIAMAALVQGAGQNTSNQTYLEERTFAHWVAMNRLAEIRLQKTPLATGHTGGTETLGGRDWRWAMDTEETPDGGMTFSVTSVTTEFAIEKNGMRFPSHAMLTASVSRRFGEGAHVVAALTGDVGEYETEVRTVFRVDQTYDEYRFFNVRSETEIRDFVLGIGQS